MNRKIRVHLAHTEKLLNTKTIAREISRLIKKGDLQNVFEKND